MTTQTFQSNVAVLIDGKPFTFLRKVDENIWQLEEQATKRIREYRQTELERLYAERVLVFCGNRHKDGSRFTPIDLKIIKDADSDLVKDAKNKRAYVKDVLNLPATDALMTPIIQETWERLGKKGKPPHFITVCRWRNNYLQHGKSINPLVAQNHRKGNRKARFPEIVVEIAKKAINRIYMTLERATRQDVLDAAVLDVIRENQLQPSDSKLPRPTHRLVRRLISQIPAFDRYAARYGREAAVKRFRSVQAHRTTMFPLERAEIDHTRLDIMVVDDQTGLPLGRPWITACIDDYTRCILGIHIGFAPPSYLSVAKCLQYAFVPKASLKDEYPAVESEWLAHGVMQELVVDNGREFHSNSLEVGCFMLGIEIHYSARKTPWFKGKIERFLGSLNRGVAHGNPGTTFSNIFEKGDYDPQKHAVVRLNALKEACHIWVADHYHQKPHRVLKMSPHDAWKSSIDAEHIRLPENLMLLDAIAGRIYKRTLTHKGIEYNSLFYNSPELKQILSKHRDKLDVEIRVNPEDIGYLYVVLQEKNIVHKVTAIAKEYAIGMTEWQHELCKKYAARHLHKYDDPRVWLEAKEKIRQIFGGERKWKQKAVRQNRAAEKKAQSGTRAPNITLASTTAYVDTPASTPAQVPIPLTLDAMRSVKRFTAIQQNRSDSFILHE